ncbi:hypothetical protein DVH05_025135 [Phytophthora capsici]|nr:hypothetical protein DVH05_025135 [Phytophthora capsici]
MSLSGRQQSIYGAPLKDGKKKALKPQRPKSRIVLRKNGLRRPAPLAHRDNQISPSETVDNSTQTDLELPPSSPSLGRRSVNDEKVAPAFVARVPPSLRENLRKPLATKGTNGENIVISLYGDGFLEIPLSDTSTSPESTESLGNCGFSISMLLFKAADTDKSKAKIEAGGARHRTPELDDTGEFVRWLCCGSTNRSIFGCSSSKAEETSKRSNVFQGKVRDTVDLE